MPNHLRDASYRAAASLGHGEGYAYPHDDPRGWTEQQYRPDSVAGSVYYEPSEHGYEAKVVGDLEQRRAPRRGVKRSSTDRSTTDRKGRT